MERKVAYDADPVGRAVRNVELSRKKPRSSLNTSDSIRIRTFNFEVCLIAAAVAATFGLVLLALVVNQRRQVDFGLLQYEHTLSFVVVGATLAALGFQTILFRLPLSILNLGRQSNAEG